MLLFKLEWDSTNLGCGLCNKRYGNICIVHSKLDHLWKGIGSGCGERIEQYQLRNATYGAMEVCATLSFLCNGPSEYFDMSLGVTQYSTIEVCVSLFFLEGPLCV